MGDDIQVIDDAADLQAFLQVARNVYAGDRLYCPTPEGKVVLQLRREAFRDRQRLLLARSHETTVARVAARLSPDLVDEQGKPFGMLGFFEAREHLPIVEDMLREGVAWLRQQGAGRILGPMDGDTWHKYRLNVGPMDRAPFMMEPYNPEFYPAVWESAGFSVLESYYSKQVDDPALAFKNTEKFARRSARNFKLRRIDVERFDEELDVLHRLSCEIFSNNFMYSPISLLDFKGLYDGVQSLLDPDFIWFVHTPEGEDIGFIFAVPDYARALTSMRGQRNLAAKLRFAWARRHVDAVNIKTLGVVPRFQRTGAALWMMHHVYGKAVEKGFAKVNLCLIRDGNPSGRMDGGVGDVLRRYHLYEYGSKNTENKPTNGTIVHK